MESFHVNDTYDCWPRDAVDESNAISCRGKIYYTLQIWDRTTAIKHLTNSPTKTKDGYSIKLYVCKTVDPCHRI